MNINDILRNTIDTVIVDYVDSKVLNYESKLQGNAMDLRAELVKHCEKAVEEYLEYGTESILDELDELIDTIRRLKRKITE